MAASGGASESRIRRVASPASTGEAGPYFEQHVDAYWLAQLLVHGVPPILHDCSTVEVNFQTEHLGWHTDDFLIVGKNGSGHLRKLVGQVKRTFTVSAANDECKEAVLDFWRDYKDARTFSVTSDRFALVTLRGTNTLLEHFSGLLDCARASTDASDFEHRLATPGFISAKTVRYCDELRTIVGSSEGKSISAADLWPFLRVLHVLSLDLNSATRQTEALIKTLLAHMTSDQDPVGVAETTWNELLSLVSEGMPGARSFRRDDLPERMQQRHAPVGVAEHGALRALNDHSKIVLSGIRSTIGDSLHLARARLVQQVIEQLESCQIVLITGAAGSGKSGVAKDAIAILAADHFTFAFRAEEFARAHLDDTLQSSQIPTSATKLGAILAGQTRKVLLVESVERLLERPIRDAFGDLLTLMADDKGWRLVLTCRDYSAELVRTAFLQSASVAASIITVPPLDDEELEQVQATLPMLAHPLANAALRKVLRNPYVLDRARQVSWSTERPLPRSEREFRILFWREIVRADHRVIAGMPRRRAEAFIEIALRRARSLTLFAPSTGVDPDIIDALRRESLIMSPQPTSAMVAPAHDVLEDWALLEWIQEQYAIHQGSLAELAEAIGPHPAVRRTYRRWATELVEQDPDAADSLLEAVAGTRELPAHFRDDTLVSLLRSSSASGFLEKHNAQLFANEKEILQRVIHLLRVACVTTPEWLGSSPAQVSTFNVPKGPAWACILRLVHSHLGSFGEGDSSLLLGLIEDWARGVTWHHPYPDGAEAVAAIAHWLLPHFDDFGSDKRKRRTLQVIARIPNADRERFAVLLRGGRDGGRDDTTRLFRGIILEGLEGMPAARDMPDLSSSVIKEYLLCAETDLLRDDVYWGTTELEPLFGIKPERAHGFFPASAYHGLLLPLLRNHPREDLDLLVTVFNHSADWYAHLRIAEGRIEPPVEVTLEFADGTTQIQWCNARLWNLYRGTSVGPYVLQSFLMALERWLLELAEVNEPVLDMVLMAILQRSGSAALTAVVASVATAFPHASVETLLVLLKSPDLVRMDRQRLAQESHAPSNVSRWLPQINAESGIYDEERREADAHKHRRHDLEAAIANLQLGPYAPRVHEILDRQRSAMPPIDQQNEEDRLWRLAMHRMDLRQYTVAPEAFNVTGDSKGPTSAEDECQHIPLTLKDPDPDVKQMVEESASKAEPIAAGLGLLTWGLNAFNHEEEGVYDPGQWRLRLQQAIASYQANDSETKDEFNPGRDGPGFVAAVCVRDYWSEMTDEERRWCIDVVCSEVGREGNNWDDLARVQQNRLSADRVCAWVVPLLLNKSLDEVRGTRVHEALATALTHPVIEVRSCAAAGVGTHLWTTDRGLVVRCVNALALEATTVHRAFEKARRPYTAGRSEEIWASVSFDIRERLLKVKAIPDDAYQVMDPTTGFGVEANRLILAILRHAPTDELAIAAFERLARQMVDWWDSDDVGRSQRGKWPRERDFQAEAVLGELLADFLLRTSAATAATIVRPIADAIDRHPREVHPIVERLIVAEDHQPNPPQFWAVWQLFADGVRGARWLAHIDDDYARGRELISAVFLGTGWREEVRHWRSLEGYADHVHTLFKGLPPSATILEDYVRFLYYVGEQSLPQAFVRIARRLKHGNSGQMMRGANTVFLLESLLRRYVYGRPLELKRDRELREAVLFVLDRLVENGSSAGFRMRDDFVTPAFGS